VKNTLLFSNKEKALRKVC